jgi:hypothetical protein
MPGMLKGRKFIVYAVVSVVLATPAFAYRLEFAARREGKPLQGAEVCFFHAGDTDEPLELYLRSDEVRCFSADSVIEMTTGRWLYYLKHADGWMSSAPSVITYSKAVAADIFGTRVVDLNPAGTIDFSALPPLGTDESFGLYISNAGTAYLPMLIPIARGEQPTLVPAGMPLFVLRLWHHQIVDISNPLTIERGARMTLTAAAFPAAGRGHSTIMTWVTFAPEARNPDTEWDRLPAPDVTLIGNGMTLTPSLTPRSGFGADGALFVFRNVPTGHWTAAVTGKFWTRGELPLDLATGFTATRTGLMTRPAGAVDVDWSIAGLPPRAATCPGETPAAETRANALARLLACPQWQPSLDLGIVDLQQCRAVSERTLDAAARHTEFQAVPPGNYILAVKQAPFGLSRSVANVNVGEAAHASLIFEAFTVSGRLTLDGHPLTASIEFRGGSAITDDDGQYVAALPNAPRDLPVLVRNCDDKKIIYTSLPSSPLIAGGRYDINITSNAVNVSVVDAATRQPIANANVQVGAFAAADDDAGEFIAGVEPGADGHTTVSNVPVNRQLVVCAAASQYRRHCSDRFSMAGIRNHGVTVALERKDSLHGRIVSPAQFAWGRIYFVGPDGVVREETALATDGTFVYSRKHEAPEYLVVASNAPLFVSGLPMNSPEVLELALPAVRARELQVSIDPRSPRGDALVGLFVGGLYVPGAALSVHQSARGFQSAVYGRGPLTIPAVLATGDVQVTIGPAPQDVGKTFPVGLDPFLLPQYANVPRREVPADGRIVF